MDDLLSAIYPVPPPKFSAFYGWVGGVGFQTWRTLVLLMSSEEAPSTLQAGRCMSFLAHICATLEKGSSCKKMQSQHLLHWCYSKEQCSSDIAKWACLKSLSPFRLLMCSFSLSTVQLKEQSSQKGGPLALRGKSHLFRSHCCIKVTISTHLDIQLSALSSDWTEFYSGNRKFHFWGKKKN